MRRYSWYDRQRPSGQAGHSEGMRSGGEDDEQSKGPTGPHEGEQQGESSREKHRQEESEREEGGTRDARAEGKLGKQRARAREGMGREEEMAAAESMRGEVGTHESKRRKVETERREDWETGQGGSGDTREQRKEQRPGNTRQEGTTQ